MPDLTVYRDLLRQVEEARGADQELDARILCALLAPANAFADRSPYNGAWCIYTPTGGKAPGRSLWETPHPWRLEHASLTASIDAAVALVERALPDHRAGFQPCISGGARAHIIRFTAESATLVRDALEATPALAICAALLRAKIAQTEAGHAGA